MGDTAGNELGIGDDSTGCSMEEGNVGSVVVGSKIESSSIGSKTDGCAVAPGDIVRDGGCCDIGWSVTCGAAPGAGVVSGLIGFRASAGAVVVGCAELPDGADAAGWAVVGGCVEVGRKGREGIGGTEGEPGEEGGTVTGDAVKATVGSGAVVVGGVADGARVSDGANSATGVGVTSGPVLGLEVVTSFSCAAGAVAAGAALRIGAGKRGACETGRESTGPPVDRLKGGDKVGAGGATTGTEVMETDMGSRVSTSTPVGVDPGVGDGVELAPRSDIGDGVSPATAAGATVSSTTGIRGVGSCASGAPDGPGGRSRAALGDIVAGRRPLREVGEGVSKTAGYPGFAAGSDGLGVPTDGGNPGSMLGMDRDAAEGLGVGAPATTGSSVGPATNSAPTDGAGVEGDPDATEVGVATASAGDGVAPRVWVGAATEPDGVGSAVRGDVEGNEAGARVGNVGSAPTMGADEGKVVLT